ncbi:unnamed protein product, partial [Durusdinium trenchii]
MVLQPVDELSDDGANQGLSKTGDPQAVPKAKTQPKPKSLKPATSRVDSGASSPKKRPATASGSTPALKRPAASREPGKDEKVTIGKGLYKTGIYGFKINGQEKLRETMVREALNKKAEETKDEAASDPATENLDGDFEGEEEEPGEADE